MKLKLNMDEMAEDFFEDTRLLGIVASIKSYQFCWQLNNLFRLNFRINPDVEIPLTRKGRLYYFGVFEYKEPNSSLYHYLYNNHNDGEYLLPEFKHLDFLWLLKGDIVMDDALQNIINSIKAINAVRLVTELTNEKIKNKGHLIF